MGKRLTVPLALGGQHSVGNAASIPDGYVRALNNHLTRPGRLPARPPFIYDSLMAINGLCNFDDTTNRVRRLLAINTGQQLFEKATSGEAWSAALATAISGTRLTDSADYRGTTVMMFDDGNGLPSGAASFDGTNISTSPFDSAIQSRGIVTFDERYYLIYPRVTVTPLGPSPLTDSYNWTNSAIWHPTNINVSTVSSGAVTSCRLTPTSIAAGCSIYYLKNSLTGIVNLAPIVTPSQTYVWSAAFRGVDPLLSTPFTMEWYLFSPRGNVGNYAVPLDYVLTAGGFLYRCTTAGTVAAGAGPAYGTTINGITIDGTATFTCISTDTIAALEGTVPSISENPNFTRYFLPVQVPTFPNTVAINMSPRLKLFNTTTPLLTSITPIDISLTDGLADGDSRKANFGQQFTAGSFYYPFFNNESATTATIDMEEIVWSEIGLRKVIRASNTYKLRESVGRPTAGTAIGGRLMAAKRNAIWQFQDTGDPDIPIRKEKFMAGIGIVGPRAQDKFEDEWFFIGENDCYRYKVGDDIPKPFTGDGMRETIMAKGANWVESQSTYKRPILAIDQQQLIVWVYTQKGKLFAYDLRSERWSTHYVSNNAEVDCMIWNPNTGNFYVAFGGYGLTRMDYAASANDTIDNTANSYPGDMSIVFRPIELRDPGRYDAFCESAQVLYATSIDQAGQTVTMATSYDQGATFPNSADYTPVTVSTNNDFVPMTLDVWEGEPSITLKLTRSGKLGERSWSLATMATAIIKVMRGEFPKQNPTPISSNF